MLCYMQGVTCQELKIPNRDEELRWTSFPKLCQKCFGVKRKRVETESIMSKLHGDFVPESLPSVKRMNRNNEHGDEKDCSSSALSSETLLTVTDSMLIFARAHVG